MNHAVEEKDGKIICRLCRWTWTRTPVSGCPGVPRYDWGKWSPELRTKTQLRRLRLKPGTEPRGAYYRNSRVGKPDQFLWLYAISEAVPLGTGVAENRASFEAQK